MSQEAAPTPPPNAGLAGLIQRRGFRQFVKFCIVGTGSTFIHQGVLYVVLIGLKRLFAPELLPTEDPGFALVLPAATIGFLGGVTNGYLWNRRWTFRSQAAQRGVQYAKFVAVNTIGLGLNLGILSIVKPALAVGLVNWVPSQVHNPRTILASLIATGFVVFWNFLASKYWTFAD